MILMMMMVMLVMMVMMMVMIDDGDDDNDDYDSNNDITYRGTDNAHTACKHPSQTKLPPATS